MNTISIRRSKNPRKRTSYACFFFTETDNKIGPVLIGTYTTDNGSFVEIGRLINNWCNHDSVPAGMDRGVLPQPRMTQQEMSQLVERNTI